MSLAVHSPLMNARAALLPVALATGSAGAERAIRDGLAAGMKATPILVGAERIDAAGADRFRQASLDRTIRKLLNQDPCHEPAPAPAAL